MQKNQEPNSFPEEKRYDRYFLAWKGSLFGDFKIEVESSDSSNEPGFPMASSEAVENSSEAASIEAPSADPLAPYEAAWHKSLLDAFVVWSKAERHPVRRHIITLALIQAAAQLGLTFGDASDLVHCLFFIGWLVLCAWSIRHSQSEKR